MTHIILKKYSSFFHFLLLIFFRFIWGDPEDHIVPSPVREVGGTEGSRGPVPVDGGDLGLRLGGVPSPFLLHSKTLGPTRPLEGRGHATPT